MALNAMTPIQQGVVCLVLFAVLRAVPGQSTQENTILDLSVSESVLSDFVIHTFQVNTTQFPNPQFVVSSGAQGDFIIVSMQELKVSGSLNFEVIPEYNFFVTARSSGDTIETFSVTVKVINVNDNIPVFDRESFTVYLPYSGQPELVTIANDCSDADAEPFNVVSFANRSNTTSLEADMLFAVEPYGAIRRRQNISLSVSSMSYTLFVVCSDGSHADTAIYTVVAQELNLGPPMFSPPFVFNVTETNLAGEAIGSITLTDPNDADEIFLDITGGFVVSFAITKTADFVWDFTYRPVLDREVRSSISVSLTARDEQMQIYRTRSTEQEFTLNVLDINDNAPQFMQPFYELNIPRSFSESEPIESPQCTDMDDGINAEISYVIVSGDSQLFRVNADNGSLFLASGVDRADLVNPTGHIVTIRCSDKGTPPLTATTVVAIAVPEDNTAAPQVMPSEPQTLNVAEDIPVNAELIDFSATDADGDDVTFTIEHFQMSSRYVSIDSATGSVTLISALDYDSGVERLIFSVVASDSRDLSTTVVVTIDVSNVDDQELAFREDDYVVDLTEANSTLPLDRQESESHFLNVTCFDPDGLIEVVNYSLEDVQPSPMGFYFEISNTTGYLIVYNYTYLDYDILDDQTSQYRLTVHCSSPEDSFNGSSTVVVVNIVGINEYTPTIDGLGSLLLANERQPLGTAILSIDSSVPAITELTTSDADRGDSVYVEVSLNINEPYFEYDPDIGVFQTASELDMDTLDSCDGQSSCFLETRILGCDRLEGGKCTSRSFFILIMKVNDEVPMFSQDSYNVSVREDVTVGSEIVPIVCTDADRDVGAAITVVISDTSAYDDVFNVEPLGIKSRVRFDYETTESYSFVVNCSDGEFSNTALVYIQVIAVNEHTPRFVNVTADNIYYFDVSRTLQPLEIIGYVKAEDDDEGTGSNLEFDFKPISGTFRYSEADGGIQLLVGLTAFMVPNYTYTLTVTDGTFSSQTNIVINILGGNFHRPVWVEGKGPSVEEVRERAEPGTVVHTLQCSDNDEAETDSSRVSYLFTSDESRGAFRVNETTGEVIVVTGSTIPADVSTLTFAIGLRCVDNGIPAQESTGFLYINIIPVPVNPQINISANGNGSIEITVREDLLVNDIVTNITTVNFNSNNFRCSIADDYFYTTASHPFCQLRLKKRLDAETMQSHSFSMEVTDALNTITTGATVYIQDVNDNMPDCSSLQGNLYSVNVNADVGDVIIANFNCSDPDFGPNGLITYSLPASTNQFEITTPGSLTVKNSLTATGRFFLEITASDNGTENQLSTVLQLTVEVVAVNTAPPVFFNLPNSIVVLESTPIYTVIFTAFANDSDVGFFGQVTYRETSGNAFFSVDKNGDVRLRTTLNAAVANSFSLQIEASDTDKTDTAFLNISVSEVNDFTPTCTSEVFYLRGLQEGETSGMFEDVFDCSDGDSGLSGTLHYLKMSGPDAAFINIMETSGTVQVAQPADYEEAETLSISVTVSDMGSPSRSTEVQLIVVIDPVNEFAPDIQSLMLETSVFENTAVGTQMFLLTVTDDDRSSQADGQVSVSLSGEASSDFILQPVNSMEYSVAVATVLDFESRTAYTLLVTAVDRSNTVPKSATTELTINLKDVNDNAPQFGSQVFTGSVDALASAVGDTVVTLDCSDVEDSTNVTIELISAPEFLVLGENGATVEVSSSLPNGESTHSFSANCTDMGEPSMSAIVLVIVLVSPGLPDITFIQSSLHHDVSESTPVLDSNSNSNSVGKVSVSSSVAVRYRIPGGNDFFAIDERLGDLRLKQALDYETNTTHIFTVEAYLLSNSDVSTNSLVQIDVTNENDNIPVFLNDSVNLELTEEANTGLESVFVLCSDNDDGSFGDVTYSLTSDSGSEIFGIQSLTGDIYFLPDSRLDFETDSLHILSVTCSDGQFSDSLDVYVTVLPVNEYAPSITSSSSVTATESLPIGSEVFRIMSEDLDGAPHGSVRYGITGGNEEGVFMLNTESGTLFLLDNLDYENATQFTLQIEARDDGNPDNIDVRTSSVSLTINVMDENDNAPTFSQSIYPFQTREEEATSTSIGSVICSDLDSGSNGAVSQALVDPSVPFQLGSGAVGELLVFGVLTPSPYILTVVCTDGGSTPRSSSAIVIVNVEARNGDINFVRDQYIFQLTEAEADQNTVLGSITAYDNATNMFVYSLVGAPSATFVIDQSSGQLTLLRSLDYELESDRTLNFFVRASSTTTASQQDVAVVVQITNVNDEGPQFDETIYVKRFREALEPPRDVGITALCSDVDDDADPTANVRYSLAGDSTGFNIDTASGMITTVAELDVESEPVHDFEVVCTDSSGLTDTVSVRINVDPFNEFTPTFERESYTGTVLEGESAVSVLTVKADDRDFVKYGTVVYSIVGGNEGRNFEISSTSGNIVVVQPLDFEAQTEYTLTVLARDDVPADDTSGSVEKSSTATVVITVIDTNDEVPVITPEVVVVNNLQRDSPVGTVATIFTCEDPDSGEAGRVELSLVSGDIGHFELNAAGQLVTTTTPLNPSYTINVRCQDFGLNPKSSMALVLISPNSTNVNTPRFVDLDERILLLPSDLNRTDCLYAVTAADGDDPNTVDGMFSIRMTPVISSPLTYFDIDNDLSCIKSVNGGQIDLGNRNTAVTIVYQLVVEDSGVPSLSTAATVQIVVTANSPPSLPETLDELSVDEVPGTLLYGITCTDTDLEDPLAISIISGNTGDIFEIHNNPKTLVDGVMVSVTGDLQVRDGQKLDYDVGTRTFALTIQCSDSSLETTVPVTVNVLPKNEFDPSFVSPAQFNVPENIYSGFRVTTLVPTDLDAGEDGNVAFTLNSWQRFFSLTPSGELTMIGDFDYDDGQETFRLSIITRDQAASGDTSEQRSTTATITVALTNVNDIAPVPNSSDYSFSVNASTSVVGTSVGSVSCTDEDRNPSTVVTYTMLNNVSGLFSVNTSTGGIEVSRNLFERDFDNYDLLIECADDGHPVLRSTMVVGVSVFEQNLHAPVFVTVPTPSDLTKSELFNLTEVIATFVASDSDVGVFGKITYSLNASPEDSNIFTIHPNTGDLSLLRMLDFETASRHEFDVVATDGLPDSSNRMSATASVIFSVEDENEHFPRCTQPFYIGYVRMSSLTNDVILSLNCTDDDRDDSPSYVQQPYTEGSSAPFFIRGDLDGDIVYTTFIPSVMAADNYYRFSVEVSDSVSRSGVNVKFVVVNITIAYLFSNDHTPQFAAPSFSIDLAEDTGLGASVFVFAATDDDRGLVGEVTYSIGGTNAVDFSINPSTGELLLADSLDAETQPELTFEVIATDGDPFSPRSSSVNVTVSITDVNDNAPFCSPNYLALTTLSGTSQSVVVGSLNCDDSDRLPVNTQLGYSISPDTVDHPFGVNPSSGDIIVSDTLIPSTSFFFTVVVSDTGSPSLSSEVDVVVEVYRENQAPPMFARDMYYFTVDETVEILSVIGELSVTDDDSPASGFRFNITESNPDFHVDFETGRVRVIAPMDYEQQTTFEFDVLVRDGGSFDGTDVLTGTTTVNVTVRNINDHEPELSGSGIYGTTVNVTTTPADTVLEFTCIDRDIGPFGVVSVSYEPTDVPFDLLSGPSNSYRFVANSDLKDAGGISHSINVSCTDGLYTTTGQVFIAIRHPGDPVFAQIVYQWDVPEDSPLGANYTDISADTNSGTALSYSITSGNGDNLFRVGPDSAALSLAFELDYEVQRRHGLVIRATDGNGNFSEVLVIVNVLDVSEDSDLVPPSASLTVPHSQSINDPFGLLKCTNGTVNRGDRFNFTFVPESDVFTVDDLGVLRLPQQLDETPAYVLPVFCHNLQTPDAVASGIVTIKVIFENKYTPSFDLPTYQALLPEDFNVSATVATVVARDTDIGSFGQLEYRLLSGNTGNKFFINSTSGEVSLLSSLDYETQQTYNLTVVAVDGGATAPDDSRNTGTTTVSVRVQDTNDNAPLFTQNIYQTGILTDHELLQPVLTVSCTDADSGANMLVDYSIRPESETFALNGSTIVLREELESENVYTLRVFCMDRGRPSQSSSSQAVIIVSPIDVGAPEFNQTTYSVSLNEDHPVLLDFYQITATPANPTLGVSYSVEGGDGEDTFGIEAHSGTLFTLNRLNAVLKSEYYIVVSASNVGTNALSSSRVTVVITIVDVNDNAPMFLPGDFYRGSVLESANLWTPTDVTVRCEDSDTAVNSVVSYSVASAGAQFGVGSNGAVFVNSGLDYETSVEHTVLIECTDSGSPPQSSTATVVIRVLSVNEHAPSFSENYTFEGVQETTGFGVLVGTVEATDLDNGAHGTVSYRLVDSGLHSSFQVHTQSGAITVSRTLDFEEEPEHDLIVIAEDSEGRTSTADVKVVLSDVNDNDPELFPSSVVVELQINASLPAVVSNFRCSDVDTVPSPGASLSIASDSSGGQFSLQPRDSLSSVLVLSQRFSGPSLHTVRLSCTDGGGRQSSPPAVAAVTVYETRDLIPRFQPSTRYQATVPEGEHSGRFVTSVRATTQTSASPVYQVHDGDSRFSVDSASGRVSVSGGLDVQVQKVFNVIVNATADGHSSLAVVVVSVEDVNDHAPVLTIPEGTSVDETVRPPSALTTVFCSDEDEGSNGETAVSLSDPTAVEGLFAVSSDGVLSLTGPVDADTDPTSYTISLTCSDGGNPSLSTTGHVTVAINPVNEYPPVFYPSVYEAEISEYSLAGDAVLPLNVSDRDAGMDGMVMVTISSRGGSTDFAVAADGTGLVVRQQPLNAATRNLYHLELVATDFGRPTVLTSFAEADIHLRDINEPPTFSEEAGYMYMLADDSSAGTPVGDVICLDGDVGSNAELSISLLPTGDYSSFSLLSVSDVPGRSVARVFTNAFPITENQALEVACSDAGSPALSLNTTLSVAIIPANENPPVFTNIPTSVTVGELDQPPFTIFRVSASDLETPTSLRYEIVGGNSGTVFDINANSGEVSLVKAVDYEVLPRYSLLVRVYDGSPVGTLQAEAFLHVNLTNSNDQPPTLSGPNAVSLEESSSRETFASYTCMDRDDFPVQFFVEGDEHNQFVIDRTRGNIILSKALDYEEASSHEITIVCMDQPTPLAGPAQTVSASLTVNVVPINAFPPQFTSPSYQFNVSENTNVGSPVLVGQVSAIDFDNRQGAQIEYTILEKIPNLPAFSLNRTTGNVYLTSFVDRETDPMFQLIVKADDGDTIAGSLTATTNVTITIVDINDNTPTCTNETYVHLIYEGVYQDYQLSALDCEDRDDDHNGRLTYTIVSESISGGIEFEWDDSRGAVKLTGTVHPGVLDLSVLVSDQGTPSLSVSVQVILNIVVNDTVSLRFTPSSFTVSVREDSEVGDVVLEGTTFIAALLYGTTRSPEFSLIANLEVQPFFSIEPSQGNVILRREIDYENRTELGLVISAFDGNYTAFCTLVVVVLDVNDNPPVFVQSNFGITVREEAVLENVTQVHADDADTGLGGEVRYRLAASSEFFSVNGVTGDISVTKAIDHELHERLVLQVVAYDLGTPSFSSSILIDVTIDNINDNIPEFNSTQYLVYLTNSDPVGTVLVQLSATDKDNLSPLTFSITSTPCPSPDLPELPEVRTLFGVEDSTQELRLIQTLPDDGPDIYYFTVLVSDGDHINRACVQTVVRTVTLLDAFVLEGSVLIYDLTGKLLQRGVSVTASTVYAIIDGNVDSTFQLESTPGSLWRVASDRELDRETIPEFRLFIDVSDPNGLNVTVLLRVTVQDVNDNPPVFESDSYRFSVAEGPRSDSGPFAFAQLRANDSDILLNGFVTYFLEENPDDQLSTVLFSIDPSTGLLTLRGFLDRESVGEHVLTVRASDAGNPTMSATAVVTIDVTDINDNDPVFDFPITDASILPGSLPDTLLVALTATDADLGANGEIDFTVSVNHPTDLFRVETSKRRKRAAGGNVPFVARIVAADVIVESYTDLRVTVTAQDRGVGAVPTTLTFTLLVQNTPPAFLSSVYSTQVLTGTPPLEFVMTLSAVDKDRQTVSYRKKAVVDDDKAPFAVTGNNGRITVLETIDDTWPAKYFFEVVAEDTNSPTPGSSSTFVVVNVYDTDHIVIVESCHEASHWDNGDNIETARAELESHFHSEALKGSVFVHDVQGSEVKGVQSELWLILVAGTYYQNWTSPDVSTSAIARTVTKSFAAGETLQSALGSFSPNDLGVCFLRARAIPIETPAPTLAPEPPISPTLIAVIVVVLFLFIALCVMVACICCYCHYARKDKKEADKNYFVAQRLAVDQYGWAGVDQIDPEFMPVDPNMNLLYQEQPEDFHETDFTGYPPYGGNQPQYYNEQMHSFGADTHATLPMETEESSVTSLESETKSGGNFTMGPFLEAVMDKWEESEQVLSKDRKKYSRRH